MNNINSTYYAKIMLFGEYSVIFDSMGLTIPYAHFQGKFRFMSRGTHDDYDFAIRSNRQLKSYADHLHALSNKGHLTGIINLDALNKDISSGLYFDSSIPSGYGIGSSGALVAAIFGSYGNLRSIHGAKSDPEKIKTLKGTFSEMESYFHGTSSGIDPLLCYIKHPLLIRNKSDIQTVNIPRNKFSKEGAIFLLDSGQPGETEPLVRHFIKRSNDPGFKDKIINELIPLNDNCISSLLMANASEFTSNLRKLSEFQYRHFQPMIPNSMNKLWEEGLSHGKYSMKLCGSGGGGFMLAFADNYQAAVHELNKRSVEYITVYKNAINHKQLSFIFV